MSYTRWQTTWRNDPSGATPAPAAFFQYIEDNNVAIDARVTTLETSGGGGTGAVSSVAGRTGVVTLTKTDVGLINVDNTSDVSKPVSTLQTTAINAGDALAIPKSVATTKGDILGASASSVIQRLPVGTNGQVLTANSSATLGVDWETPAGGGGATIPFTTKGDLLVGDSLGAPARLPRGTDGYGLTANNAASNGLGVLWTPKLYQTIQSNGTSQNQQTNLNFTAGFTVSNNPGNASTDVSVSSSSIPGYTTINRNGGTGGDKDLFVIPAIAGATYYHIDLSTIPSGDQGIVTVKDPTDPTKQTEINIALQQGTSSRPWDLSPSTIAWENGMSPSTSIFNQSSLFDFTINTITMVKLTWMGANYGYVGKVTTAIPPLFMPLANIPTSWTMTAGVTPWNSINNQAVVTPIYFMRNTPVAVQEWMYNEVCHYCSAALRTRLSNNNYCIEYGSRFNCDGPRGSVNDRGGLEWAFGFSGSSSLGGFISLGGADTENSSPAALRGVIAHEMSHGVSANYYGGANPLPGPGIGNGSEPALMSQHSTLVTLQNDCINNGNGQTFSDEWFAELLRGMRVGDNGVLQPTASGSPLGSVGSGTNAGPGGTGGTPQNRADRFVTYINSLSLV